MGTDPVRGGAHREHILPGKDLDRFRRGTDLVGKEDDRNSRISSSGTATKSGLRDRPHKDDERSKKFFLFNSLLGLNVNFLGWISEI